MRTSTASRRSTRVGPERLAQQHLRVCWENRVPSGNCGRCCKCAITEICLHHLGVLEDYGTFPPVDDLVALAELDDIPRFRMVARSLLEDGLEERLARPIRDGLERAGTPVPRQRASGPSAVRSDDAGRAQPLKSCADQSFAAPRHTRSCRSFVATGRSGPGRARACFATAPIRSTAAPSSPVAPSTLRPATRRTSH